MHEVPGSPTFTASYHSPLVTNVTFLVLSLLLTLHNKYIFENVLTPHFNSSNLLLLCQNAFTIACLLLVRASGRIHFELFKMRSRFVLFAASAQAIQVVSGLAALAYLNVILHGVLKRLTCVASWSIEVTMDRRSSTWRVVPALLVMLAGSFVAARGDFHFHGLGYALALTSCVFQGAVFELGRLINSTSFSSGSGGSNSKERNDEPNEKEASGYAEVLYFNSVATASVAVVLLLMFHQEAGFVAPHVSHATVLVHVVINGVLATLMNACIFVNVVVSSPLAHATTGNLKAAAQTLVGYIIFDSQISHSGWLGVAGNLVGGLLFSLIRYKYR